MAKETLKKSLRKASAISLLLIMLFSIGYTYAATTIYPSNFTDPSYNSVTSDQWYIGAVNLTNFFTNYQNPNFTAVNASQYLIDGVDITTLWGGNVNGTAIDITSVNSSQYLLDGVDISTLWGDPQLAARRLQQYGARQLPSGHYELDDCREPLNSG